MSPRHLRVVRGSTAAAVATLLAATSHTVGGGGAPSLVLVGTLAILVTPIAIAMIGTALSAWRVGVTVLAAQVLFHAAFAMTAGVGAAGDVSTGTTGGHAHHVVLSLDASSATVLLPDAVMTLSHTAAALLTMAALYCGERMLRGLGRGIRSIFARAQLVAPRAIPAVRPVLTPTARILVARTVLSDVSRRGPPAFVIAAR